MIDEFRIYNHALTQEEIQQVKDLTGAPVGLIGYWCFDGDGIDMSLTAEPAKTAVITFSDGVRLNWSQAGGAFFRSISRN